MKFRVGDIVRVIDNDPRWLRGLINPGIVLNIRNDNKFLSVFTTAVHISEYSWEDLGCYPIEMLKLVK